MPLLPPTPRIKRILADMRGPQAPDLSQARVSALPGGITNENYLVTRGRARFVLRVSGKGRELLGIERERERRCARIAAESGIGAELIAFAPEHGAVLSRYIPGRTLSKAAARDPATLRRVVRSIKICHRGPAFPGVFSPFETVRAYHALARRRGVALPGEAERALALMARVERELGPCRERRPCHNDLLAGNLIDDGRKIRIIDWEYAAMGDPFFDLGNFAANQGLGPRAARLLLKEYLGAAGAADVERLALQRLASDLREAFWGFAQAGVSRLDFDFVSYAAEHLGRFTRGAAKFHARPS
ncbi:MAG TPA: phosphotransferase [Elusimicrobiota bacterium]|jgi:thiamine kinase-like enzyme|nr:phosphotransferase [Elusimicrobiota bacterium]